MDAARAEPNAPRTSMRSERGRSFRGWVVLAKRGARNSHLAIRWLKVSLTRVGSDVVPLFSELKRRRPRSFRWYFLFLSWVKWSDNMSRW